MISQDELKAIEVAFNKAAKGRWTMTLCYNSLYFGRPFSSYYYVNSLCFNDAHELMQCLSDNIRKDIERERKHRSSP